MSLRHIVAAAASASLLGLAALGAHAQEKVLNLYSARHYQTDEALYANFTKATGIRINRVDADDAGILARLKSEGTASPADVILLVDAARLWRAEAEGLFQPVKSATLDERIPPTLRGKDAGQGSAWYGFSTRARVIVYNKMTVKKEDVDTYEKLADPKNKGKVCTRSGSHPYNLSLFGSVLEHSGEAATEAWLKGVVANMARDPKGGDTDQIKAAASGECQIGLTNTYYLARMIRSTNPEDRVGGREDRGGVSQPADLGHPRQYLGGRRGEELAESGRGGAVSRVSRQRPGPGLFCRRQQRVADGQVREDREPGAGLPRPVQVRDRAGRTGRDEPGRRSSRFSTGSATSNPCRISDGVRPTIRANVAGIPTWPNSRNCSLARKRSSGKSNKPRSRSAPRPSPRCAR